MSLIEASHYIFESDKILFVNISSEESVQIFFSHELQIQLDGEDAVSFLKYYRKTSRTIADQSKPNPFPS